MLPEDLLEQVFVRSTSTALLELSRTCQTFTSAVRKERWSPLDHNALLLLPHSNCSSHKNDIQMIQQLPLLEHLLKLDFSTNWAPTFLNLNEDSLS